MLCACVNCSVIVDSKVVVAIVDDAIKLACAGVAHEARAQPDTAAFTLASVPQWARGQRHGRWCRAARRCRVRAPLQGSGQWQCAILGAVRSLFNHL